MSANTIVRFDVFISHASEDKDTFVRALAAELTRLGLRVWYDEATLTLGDSLRQKIDEGLAASDYGVVVLSPAFLSKQWPQAELDALFAREMQGEKVILPVWHKITKAEVLHRTPLLADKLAISTNQGIESVAFEIYSVIRPNGGEVTLAANGSVFKPQITPLLKSTEPITELLRSLHDVAPLLHQLDVAMEGSEAQAFLCGMQTYFCGRHILNDDIDQNLRFGIDNLLRVLSTMSKEPDRNYAFGKLVAARHCFEDFRKRVNVGCNLPEILRTDSIFFEMQQLYAIMLAMIEDPGKMQPVDLRVLRLAIALLDYGRHQHLPERRFPPISASIHHELRSYLTASLKLHLNVSIPDTLERILIGDMRGYCNHAWKELLVFTKAT